MKTTDGMTELDIYAEAGAKTRPDVSNYEAGVVPGQDLPAVWWNYFLSMFSSNSDLAHAGLSNIFAELTTVLASSGLTPDNATTTQIDAALKAKYLSRVGITVTDFNAIVTSSLPQGSVTSFTAAAGYTNGPTGASSWSGLLVRSPVAADSAILIAFGNVANVGETVNPIAFRVKSAGTWLSWLYVARRDSIETHAALTSPHSATSAATASRLIVRDSDGRAKVAAPSAADDIARLDTVTGALGVTVVATDTTLAVNTKVLVTKNVALTLPSSAAIGDSIDIMNTDSVRIKQTLEGHMLVGGQRGSNQSIKGPGVFTTIKPNSASRLIFRGSVKKVDNRFSTVLPAPGFAGFTIGVWSPDGKYFATDSILGSTRFSIYSFNNGIFTRLANPVSAITSSPKEIMWSKDSRYITVVHESTPFVQTLDISTGKLVNVTSPALLPTALGRSGSWSPDNRYQIVTYDASPFYIIYDWSSGVPVTLSSPLSTIPSYAGEAKWSPDGSILFIVSTGTAVFVYDWNSLTGVGTLRTAPATLPPAWTNGLVWSPDGKYVALAHNSSPFITVYELIGGLFIKLSNPTTLPSANGYAIDWSPDGVYVAITGANATGLRVYTLNRGILSIVVLGSLTTSSLWGCSWSPDGRYLIVAYPAAAWTIYDTSIDSYATDGWELYRLA